MTASEREYVETHIRGDIAGFPLMLVLDIVERSLNDDSCPDTVEDIMENICRDRADCFSWSHSDEDFDFWNRVIRDKDFDFYFAYFPHRNVHAKQCLNLQTWG